MTVLLTWHKGAPNACFITRRPGEKEGPSQLRIALPGKVQLKLSFCNSPPEEVLSDCTCISNTRFTKPKEITETCTPNLFCPRINSFFFFTGLPTCMHKGGREQKSTESTSSTFNPWPQWPQEMQPTLNFRSNQVKSGVNYSSSYLPISVSKKSLAKSHSKLVGRLEPTSFIL